MAENAKKPDIRFAGFTDAWEQRKLGELVHFSKGTGYSKADLKEFGIPLILYGRLYTKYQTVITEVDTFADAKPVSVYSQGGEVIVPASGETAEDISIASVVEKSGVLLGGDLNIITPPDGIDSAFLAISISNGKPHDDMAKMAQGKSVVHLHNADLEKINLLYPDHTEQIKISGYFKQLDNLITLHQRKYDKLQNVKKSMLEKMFPKNGSDVPEIRFAGFTDTWEQRKLFDIVTEVNRNDPESSAPIMMITANNGFIEQSERYAFSNAGESLKKYILLKRGELAYNHGASKLRPYGSCFSLTTAESARIPFIYHCFATGENDPEFVSTELNGSRIEGQLRKIVSSGARMDGLLNISFEEYSRVELMLPSVPEQETLSTFFRNLDNLITLHQRELEKLKNLKKACLEKMFV